jgi:hypothetical protein
LSDAREDTGKMSKKPSQTKTTTKQQNNKTTNKNNQNNDARKHAFSSSSSSSSSRYLLQVMLSLNKITSYEFDHDLLTLLFILTLLIRRYGCYRSPYTLLLKQTKHELLVTVPTCVALSCPRNSVPFKPCIPILLHQVFGHWAVHVRIC